MYTSIHVYRGVSLFLSVWSIFLPNNQEIIFIPHFEFLQHRLGLMLYSS